MNSAFRQAPLDTAQAQKTRRLRMARKRVTVTHETSSGRNQQFHDNYNGSNMTRAQFVRNIEDGNYQNYHVRNVNGLKTPVSNPDATKNNNLD